MKLKYLQKMYDKEKIVGTVKINNQDIEVRIKKDLYVQTKNKTDLLDAKTELKVTKELKEVHKNQEVGILEVKINEKAVATEKIYSVKDYKKEEKVKKKEEEKGFNVWKFLISIIIPIIIYLGYQYYQNIRNMRKRRK